MGQLPQPFYFKVGQKLFQSEVETIISKWAKNYFKVGQLLQSGTKCYFKLGQLFQSGLIISKRGITAVP